MYTTYLPLQRTLLRPCPKREDPDARAKVEADYRQKATAAGKSDEDVTAELLGKKPAWWRQKTNLTVPPPCELDNRLTQWFMDNCLTIDVASSVPLFTPQVVLSTMLQIDNAYVGLFSGMSMQVFYDCIS